MKHGKTLILVLCIALLTAGGCSSQANPSFGDTHMLAHNVYFTLNDASQEKKTELVQECHTYLKDHHGVVFFAAGTLSAEHDRPVNDRDFDVALHVIFDSAASQDTYQTAPDHLTFIERNKGNWKQVRVFDSLVE